MNHYKPYRTICIQALNLPEATQGGFQTSIQKLLAKHDLIVEKHPWEQILWKQQPQSDECARIKVVVSEMTNLNNTITNLNNLGLEKRFLSLLPAQCQLVIAEEPALTSQTKLQTAWLHRKGSSCLTHWNQAPAASIPTLSSRPAVCRDPAKIRRRVQQLMAATQP